MSLSKGILVLGLAALVTLGSIGFGLNALTEEAGSWADPSDSPTVSPTGSGDSPTKVVELDHGLLPASTSWYLVPIVVTAAADVRASFETSLHPLPGEQAGFAHILAAADEQGEVQSFGSPGTVVSPDKRVAANHGGEQVTCCAATGESDGSGAFESASLARTVRVASGETVYVGLAASGWGPNSTHTATVEIARSLGDQPASLAPSDPLVGDDVEVFDLREEAYKNGTNAQHRDETIVGYPGHAQIALEAKQAGLLFLRQDVSPGASSRLSVELPNGTEIVRGPSQDAFGDTQPYRGTLSFASGPGAVNVSWENVSDPYRHQFREGSGTASAIGVFADVPLPLRGMVERGPSVANQVSQGGGTVVEVGAEHLPARTGWFVLPVTVDENARFVLEVHSWMDMDAEGPRGAVPFYQTSDDLLRFQPAWVPATPRAQVTHEGEAASCCPDPSPAPGDDEGGIARTGRAGISGTLTPGETLHIGFVAYDWRPGDRLLFRLASSSPSLSAGDPVQGTEVVLADLFHEAYKGGTSVQTYGSPVVGEARAASVNFTADRGGFFVASWDLRGEARADISIRATDGTVWEPGTDNEVAELAGATGAGTFEATIKDAYRPGPDIGTLADGTNPDAHGMVLFADVAFPVGEVHGFRTPGGPVRR